MTTGHILKKVKTDKLKKKISHRQTNISFLNSNEIKTGPTAGQENKYKKIVAYVQGLCVDRHTILRTIGMISFIESR